METLAYLHLALAHEAPADSDCTASTSTWEKSRFFGRDKGYCVSPQQKFSTSATYSLLSLTVALSLLGLPSQASALVKQGDRGEQVTTLQKRLQELGYFQGNVTGYFGSMTQEAVIRFQQAMGLTSDGIVGTDTETFLGKQLQSSPQPVIDFSKRIWRLGDRGVQVSAIQESLAVAGFSGGANGIFDQATQDAVRRFQQAKGLTVDGVVGPQTLAAMPAIGGSNRSSTPIITTSRYDTQALQRRLQEQGFYRGSIDGVWGPQTQAAVEAAQRAYRLSAADIENGGF